MRGKNKKNIVMVVDDDLFINKVISVGLKDLAEIVVVKDGSEVLSKYKEHTPDMVLLDIHLPNISGLELLNKLLEFDPQAYIIMLSADSSKDNVLQTKFKGAKGFLAKPFPVERVIEYYNQSPTVKFMDC